MLSKKYVLDHFIYGIPFKSSKFDWGEKIVCENIFFGTN